MSTHRIIFCGGLVSVPVLICASTVSAGVTSLQNGVTPGRAYSGCTDTWISNEEWERDRDRGASETLRTGGERHILMRFEFAPIPGGDTCTGRSCGSPT